MPETLPQLPTVTDAPPRGLRSRSWIRTWAPVVAIVSILALLLAACSSNDAAAATVNSKTLDESSVSSQLDTIAKNKTVQQQAVKNGKLDPGVRAAWLTMLVQTEVAQQAIDKAGTKITKADRTAAQNWADGYFGDPSAFSSFPAGFRKDALARYAAVPAYVRTHTKAPTDAEVRTTYDEQLVRNCASRRYVSHIIVADEAAANAVEAELAAGKNFKEVAAKSSTDSQSASRGGALGCIDGQQIDATFAAAAAATPVGQISKPVKTQYGWHVIQVLDVETALPFDAVKNEIRTDLVETGPEGRLKLAKLMADAKVTVASTYGRWVVKKGVGGIEPPTSTSTSTTTKPSSPTTTTTKP